MWLRRVFGRIGRQWGRLRSGGHSNGVAFPVLVVVKSNTEALLSAENLAGVNRPKVIVPWPLSEI